MGFFKEEKSTTKDIKILNGTNIANAMKILTAKSPKDKLIQLTAVP